MTEYSYIVYGYKRNEPEWKVMRVFDNEEDAERYVDKYDMDEECGRHPPYDHYGISGISKGFPDQEEHLQRNK